MSGDVWYQVQEYLVTGKAFSGLMVIKRLSLCSQEEADTRMLLHAQDAACTRWFETHHSATVDTEVVMAVSMLSKIAASDLGRFGVSKYFRYLAIHESLMEHL